MNAPTCPQCGSPLQRLTGADGYPVEPAISAHGGPVFERARLAVCYACPRCEHVQEGR